MEDAEAELSPGCKTLTRLEFIVALLHIKVSCKWSDKSFSMLLRSLQRAFNNDENFPEMRQKSTQKLRIGLCEN